MLNKEQYLSHVDVKAFSIWFSKAILNKKITQKFTVPGPNAIRFDGLEDALRKYEWPFRVMLPNGTFLHGASYSKNTIALDRLKSGLDAALSAGTDSGVSDWCISVMEWGGVRNGNVKWLKANTPGLVETVTAAQGALGSSNDEKRVLRRSVRRFNAGMTKVYSLCVPDFVIYDSRVAAALTWFVARWCREDRRASVP